MPVPAMSPSLVSDLLDNTVFTSARGKPWRGDIEPKAWSPVGQEDYSIVPRNFAGCYVPVSNDSCMRCHADAGRFVPAGPEPQNQQTEARWNVRGSDQILSFHVFDPSSKLQDKNGIKLNQKLLDAGLLAHK